MVLPPGIFSLGWKYAEVVWWPKWPVPSPCLSCPRPWERPVPEGLDRVLVALTPFLKPDAPLGPGRAGDVKVTIAGGEAVGELFDAGGGVYMQMVQHRRGESPRVRASVGDVSTEEIVIGNPRGAVGVPPIVPDADVRPRGAVADRVDCVGHAAARCDRARLIGVTSCLGH